MPNRIGGSGSQGAASEKAKQKIAYRRGEDEEKGGKTGSEMESGEGAIDMGADLIQQNNGAGEKREQMKCCERSVDGYGHIEIGTR